MALNAALLPVEQQPMNDSDGSEVTVGERLLHSMIIFLVHHKLNSPTADIGELTQSTDSVEKLFF